MPTRTAKDRLASTKPHHTCIGKVTYNTLQGQLLAQSITHTTRYTINFDKLSYHTTNN